MAESFVWAIDENGKPTKCTAKPENRGKRNCKHRFHAEPGETQKQFFSKYLFSEKDTISKSQKIKEEMPDYREAIKEILPKVDRKRRNWAENINSMLEFNPYLKKPMFEGAVVSAKSINGEEGVDAVEMTFEYDGEKYVRTFTIPKEDELGQFNINGTDYRYVPNFSKNKLGIDIPKRGKLFIKDENQDKLCIIENGEAKLLVEKEEIPGQTEWQDGIPQEEIVKYLDGKKCNLTKTQKEALDKMHPIAKERLLKEGLEKLTSLPKDAQNDLTNRECMTYDTKVNYIISKQLHSIENVFYKERDRTWKNNADASKKFNLSGMSDKIKSDLLASSNMQLADNLNPIAALSQAQRVSYIGACGLSKDDKNEAVRLTHDSYFNLVDSNDVSLGGKIGVSCAIKGYVGDDGRLHKSTKNNLSGSDFIPNLSHSDPNRSSMAISQMRAAVPIVGGEDPKLSTAGWDRIKGSKLGANLTVAYIPESGVFEDGIVMSASAAKKFATKETKKYKTNNKDLMYKVGDEVLKGTKIGDATISYNGKIKSMKDGIIEVESTYPMTPGDKLSGRYGNKGVVTKILPDKEMPKVDGKTADLIMSPIGVAGRSNLGQIYEINDGDLNKKRTVEYKGNKVQASGGTQFIMRLNQIAEKKLSSNSNETDFSREYKSRFGEMENIVLSTSKDRLDILNYIKHQEANDGENKLMNSLKAIGVSMVGR